MKCEMKIRVPYHIGDYGISDDGLQRGPQQDHGRRGGAGRSRG